ncbi:alpha/beta fold hydrolase [Rubrivivax sp. RP6-9]|uniref:alpha/beta fold hydrolase n=1 Tax=Rubrivivax sp. RP6-9 TaxID=3415750 RepID=UPI003CC6DCD6
MMSTSPAADAVEARASGHGAPHLTLVHGSAGGVAQWDALIAHLPGAWHVHTPRLAGYDDALFDFDAPYGAQVEVARIAPPPHGTDPRVLMGHSMGGLVSAATCLAHPGRYSALVLIEPVLFGLLSQPGAAAVHQDVRSFMRYFTSLQDPTRQLDAARAMFHFWKLYDDWDAQSPARREQAARCMRKVRLECRLFDDPAVHADRLSVLGGLPVVWVTGSASPSHIRSVQRIFCERVPHTEVIEIAGGGHLCHLSHPGELAALLVQLIGRLQNKQRAEA